MSSEVASKKRRVLGVYVDYLLFAAAAAPVLWIAKSGGFELHWTVVFTAFGMLESALIKIVGSSPGYVALASVGAFLVVSALGAGNIVAGLAILRCKSVGALIGMTVFVLEAGAVALIFTYLRFRRESAASR